MLPSPISTTTATTAPSALPSPRLALPVGNYPSSVASNSRGSISQSEIESDLRELRAKAKRWARLSRNPEPEQLQDEDGEEGPTGSAAAAAVDIDLYDVAERALCNFKLPFESLSSEWASASSKGQSILQTLEDVRPRIESNLDRIVSFQRGHDGIVGKSTTMAHGATSHWDFTKTNILTLQKIEAWLQKSEHPLRSDVVSWLWRGVLFIFELFTSQDNNVAGGLWTLEQFCRALQELSVVLPSSLYHVPSREILQEKQVQAVTGSIYADVLELIGSVVRDVILPGQLEQSCPGGGIRQTIMSKTREHHHFTRWNQGVGISVNTNVPAAGGSAPTSPTGSIATRKQPSLQEWKNRLRTILEQIGYHSQLLQRELRHLQEKEKSGRFRQITKLFDEIEEAEEIEKECKRNLREMEQSMGNTTSDSKLSNRRRSDSSQCSKGLLLSGVITEAGESGLDENFAGLEEKREKLTRQYKTVRQAKEAAYAKLLEEAGHIRCDVCTYTAFEDSGSKGSKDHDVVFSSNLREFSTFMGGEGSGSDDEDSEVTTQRTALFKLYVTNESTIDSLRVANPRFLLNRQGRKALDEGPNLWSFSRILGLIKSNWRFIKTSLPNLEKGFGSEARRYAMEARDETAYFYNSTWKIYWCQPRSYETTACPVAILVLAGDDLPLSRPVDPSPNAQHNFERARHELVEYYRHNFHVPLIERGSIVSADNLAVQVLGETKRRWREVLDKMRHFVDVLTDRLYVQASNTSSIMGAVEQRKAAEALAQYNHAAGQVFKILIRVNSYESMLIETMSYLSQLGDEDMFLGTGKSDLLQFNDEEDKESSYHQPATYTNTRSQSRNGLHHTPRALKVKWQDIKRSHQDLLESLRSTKRQADSLKSLIDHEHSMHESRVSNQHSLIANIHAAEATRQADEAAAQNASMRRLTVVTFIFLPLTFVSSVFGTNVRELGQGNVPLWIFFAVGFPFAFLVLAAWGYMEFWRQGTRSDGKGGERSGRRRVEEMEMEMERLSGLAQGNREEGEERGNSRGRGVWEGGDKMV
ncbi:hypothetical protein EV426DRAFT_721513 [Tirmania nivea]|nr:hypothetical protein EV426DRAFT_721513 [Tirmania nivea]